VGTQERRSRRTFLFRDVPTLAVGGTLLAREILNPPRRDPLIFGKVDETTASELLKFSPLTVFHNVMNDKLRFETALDTEADYIDVDLIEFKGGIYAQHNEHKIVPIADKLLSLVIDSSPQTRFEKVAATAAQRRKGLYLDFKNLSEKDFSKVQRTIKTHGLEESSMFNSKDRELLEKVGAIYGPEKTFLSIGTQRALERLESEGSFKGNISLARHLASKEAIRDIKTGGYKVIVFTINDPQEALEKLRNGSDGFVSENVGLLNVWQKGPRAVQSLT
jgi:hypothetical protein